MERWKARRAEAARRTRWKTRREGEERGGGEGEGVEGGLSRRDWRSLRVGKEKEGEWGVRWRDGEEGAVESERVLTHRGHIRHRALRG